MFLHLNKFANYNILLIKVTFLMQSSSIVELQELKIVFLDLKYIWIGEEG